MSSKQDSEKLILVQGLIGSSIMDLNNFCEVVVLNSSKQVYGLKRSNFEDLSDPVHSSKSQLKVKFYYMVFKIDKKIKIEQSNFNKHKG